MNSKFHCLLLLLSLNSLTAMEPGPTFIEPEPPANLAQLELVPASVQPVNDGSKPEANAYQSYHDKIMNARSRMDGFLRHPIIAETTSKLLSHYMVFGITMAGSTMRRHFWGLTEQEQEVQQHLELKSIEVQDARLQHIERKREVLEKGLKRFEKIVQQNISAIDRSDIDTEAKSKQIEREKAALEQTRQDFYRVYQKTLFDPLLAAR